MRVSFQRLSFTTNSSYLYTFAGPSLSVSWCRKGLDIAKQFPTGFWGRPCGGPGVEPDQRTMTERFGRWQAVAFGRNLIHLD
jgi:hypothetical protein